MRWTWICLPIALLAADPQSCAAWQDDDDELRPGLVRRITVADQTAASIVTDPMISPSPTPTTSRQVWTGQFLIRGEGTHQFHAYLSGKVSVKLGEQVVLDAATNQPGWISGPNVELTFGEFPLEITADIENPGDQLKLYWSSSAFPLEPLPYHALFHAEDTADLRRVEMGRDIVEAWNCRSCHTVDGRQQALSGPSLKTLGAGTDVAWLRERLTRAEPATHSRMPAFGFSADDANAVLAYLSKEAKPPALPDVDVKRSEKEVAAGAQLLKSVGCLACHQWKELGKNPLLGGGPLEDVAQQRSANWLFAKLTDPHGVNPASRMPTFSLSNDERRQIVAALSAGDQPKITSPGKGIERTEELVARGRELVRSARCGACHELPGDVAPLEIAKPQAWTAVGGERSCTGGKTDSSRRQPRFASTFNDAIAAYLAGSQSLRVAETSAHFGERLLSTKGCLNCHDRNGSRGLSAITKDIVRTEPAWEGQTPTLQPPSLTAVGDRLPDELLAKGVRGELPRRMDWLKVRMPKFRHSNAEVAALSEYFISHDRIPEDAPATADYPVSPDKVDPQVMLAGRELTGGKGFSCVACHQLKDYVPPKVALGTRGSDLYRLGDRMRAPYFFRWTRSPLRILPGVEMPSYQRPHPTIFPGELDRQLAAIWDALHDPLFTAPTNPAVVEQLWGPSEDGRPRVLRDVLTLTAADGKVSTVPRAFAVGFANRHNVLFDLEHGCVRTWTIGDFARQRTQGKSWFWDLAGVPVEGDFPLLTDVFLVDHTSNAIVGPETGYEPRVELLGYQVLHQFTLELTYRIFWNVPGSQSHVVTAIQEVWQPLNAEGVGRFGWVRELTTLHVPKGFSAWVRQPMPQRQLADAQCSVRIDQDWQPPMENGPLAVPLTPKGTADRDTTKLVYSTSVRSPEATIPPAIPPVLKSEPVTCIPGFDGERLPLPRSIMPTALTWTPQKQLVFTSLKGHVYQVETASTNAPDPPLTLIAEGLSAPFGVLAIDRDLLVAHKPEVIRIHRFTDAPLIRPQQVVASGWGFTDDYHDWTCGIVRDSKDWFYIGLGSDYAHKNRPKGESRWRGNILRFDLLDRVEPVATGLRYPTGLALLPGDRLVVSDQQGVQNCFNEINFIRAGHRYGVPAQLDPRDDESAESAAVQIPHPWTRSVNGLAVWPDNGHPFAGQIIGAEYNGRFLIRVSVEEVDGVLQGAVFPLHRPGETNGPEELLGPMCVGFSPAGDLYVGSIHDSGWLGGLNTGDIVKFTPNDKLPNGIRRIRAIAVGFAIDFVRPVDRTKAVDTTQYKFSGYTRLWQGNYATPDSGLHTPTVTAAELSADGQTVNLTLSGLKTGHVYDVTVGDIGSGEPLWPTVGHYTLLR